MFSEVPTWGRRTVWPPRCGSSDVAWGWRRVRLEVGHNGEPVQPAGGRGLSGVTSGSQRGRREGLGLSLGTLSRLSPQVSIQEHVLTARAGRPGRGAPRAALGGCLGLRGVQRCSVSLRQTLWPLWPLLSHLRIGSNGCLGTSEKALLEARCEL